MKNWRAVALTPTTTVREAMRRIDTHSTQFAIVLDSDDRLIGTVSDGDIRRGLLTGCDLDGDVARVMHRSPASASSSDDSSVILARMQASEVSQMPLTNPEGRVIGLVLLKDLLRPGQRENLVVIMAGGMGERMRPLTERMPKPMLQVGGRPILENILLQFREQGFHRFAFSVNYRADIIEECFGDGSAWGADIQYIREPKRLGTAGSLRLLPERPSLPIIVMNGDVLTKVDMGALLDAHVESRSFATMCVCEHEYQVPFGVVRTVGTKISALEEKPVVRWLVSAGIYAIEPAALDLVPADTFFDMPTLFERARAQGRPTNAHQIRDFWLDVGRPADYARANEVFTHDRRDRDE